MESIESNRKVIKADLWEEWDNLEKDQEKKIPPPPAQKPYPEEAQLIDLVPPADLTVGRMPLIEAIKRRRSHRQFTSDPLTLEELSFLLWATQGVSRNIRDGQRVLRTVPSAGARHPFETYLLVNRVSGLQPGLYRYLSMEHKLCLLNADEGLKESVHEASNDQYVLGSAVVFIWTVIPYRSEWRYSLLAHKMVAQDSGHVCQNLYLACESISAGTCALGAYNQAKMDAVLGVDGDEEFTFYVAPVGRIE
jgi:SagB-type dehydrogenase family enzyme